jgi:hypothetical protein
MIDSANVGKGFRFIQFPFNVLEQGALTNGTITWAKQKNILAWGNRPMTAFDSEGIWRFAEATFPLDYSRARDAILAHLTPPTNASEEEINAITWMSNLVSRIDEQLSHFTSIIHWENELAQTILPMIDKEVEELDAKTLELLSAFLHQVGLAVKESGGHLARERLKQVVNNFKSFKNQPLQRTAFEYVLNQPLIDKVSIHASEPTQINDWKAWIEN